MYSAFENKERTEIMEINMRINQMLNDRSFAVFRYPETNAYNSTIGLIYRVYYIKTRRESIRWDLRVFMDR